MRVSMKMSPNGAMTKATRKLACLAAAQSLLYLAAVPAIGHLGAQTDEQGKKISIGTSEVMVDVVVRDKKGRPLNGLARSDFQVFEDGVEQEVQSFRLVRRGAPGSAEDLAKKTGTTRRGARVALDPLSSISVVAMVFDRLNPSARTMAEKAAEKYVSEALKPDDLTGVYAIGAGLNLVQPYTNDAGLLRQAIKIAGSKSANTFTSNAKQIRDMLAQKNQLQDEAQQQALAAISAAGANPVQQNGGAPSPQEIEAALLKTSVQAEEQFALLSSTQQGLATDYALLSVIDSLSKVPGRKAIMFFSEGMAIPGQVQSPFLSVVSAANRSNVTIYAVDAAGLRAESTTGETASQLNSLTTERVRQVESGNQANDTSGPGMRGPTGTGSKISAPERPLTKELEKNEDVLTEDPHSGLSLLTSETGGFLISDTNSVVNGLKRIDEDLRSHYEITYVSRNQNYDGSFRSIAVKVDKPGAIVHSRKGYYAVKGTQASPVLNFEAAAIAALSKQRNDFEVRAAALSFPEQGHEGATAFVAQAPGDSFTYGVDSAGKAFKTDFTIVALVKDDSERIVKKLSQHYTLSGPVEDTEAAKKQPVIFYKVTELPPGKYTVETVAYDSLSGKAGIEKSALEVPESNDNALRLSDVIVVAKTEKLSDAERKEWSPFHYGNTLLYPNLGTALKKSEINQLGFFFDTYVTPGSNARPSMTLSISSNGKSILTLPGELGAPNAGGRIEYAGGLALMQFSPGNYVLNISVTQGNETINRTAGFKVEP